MTTIQFWQGFMLGAALCSALTIVFTVWQDKREERENATNNQQEK